MEPILEHCEVLLDEKFFWVCFLDQNDIRFKGEVFQSGEFLGTQNLIMTKESPRIPICYDECLVRLN